MVGLLSWSEMYLIICAVLMLISLLVWGLSPNEKVANFAGYFWLLVCAISVIVFLALAIFS